MESIATPQSTMIRSASITNLLGALLKVQGDIGPVVKGKKNPHFRSSYADINACLAVLKQPLLDHGIVLMQYPSGGDKDTLEMTSIVAHSKSGETIETKQLIPLDKSTAQAMGSGSSYARRYFVVPFFNLQAVDDDANAASGIKKTTAKKAPAKKAPAKKEEPKQTMVGDLKRVGKALMGKADEEKEESLDKDTLKKMYVAFNKICIPNSKSLVLSALSVEKESEILKDNLNDLQKLYKELAASPEKIAVLADQHN